MFFKELRQCKHSLAEAQGRSDDLTHELAVRGVSTSVIIFRGLLSTVRLAAQLFEY